MEEHPKEPRMGDPVAKALWSMRPRREQGPVAAGMLLITIWIHSKSYGI